MCSFLGVSLSQGWHKTNQCTYMWIKSKKKNVWTSIWSFGHLLTLYGESIRSKLCWDDKFRCCAARAFLLVLFLWAVCTSWVWYENCLCPSLTVKSPVQIIMSIDMQPNCCYKTVIASESEAPARESLIKQLWWFYPAWFQINCMFHNFIFFIFNFPHFGLLKMRVAFR